MPVFAFKNLPAGTRFVLYHPTPHGSTVLEKIEPVPYLNKAGIPIEGLFWTARWCDGPHKDSLCVIVHGSEKDPYQVIPLP